LRCSKMPYKPARMNFGSRKRISVRSQVTHLSSCIITCRNNTPENAASTSPPPLSDPDPADASPELRPGKEQLLKDLHQGRQKLRNQLSKYTPDQLLTKRFISQFKDLSLFELLLYNMRHVQHHTAQLNMLLRQNSVVPPKWVSKTEV